MSVALLITKEKEGRDELVPIATESGYINLWMPVIRQLKLEWMPLFQTGISLEAEDLPRVLKELEVFVTAAEKLKPFRGDYEHVHGRAVNLLQCLKVLQEDRFEELFIG